MAKQTINIGSSANKGDGDPLRTAFTKINSNFTELYDRAVNTDAQTLTLNGNTLSISGGNSVSLNISPTGDLKGSVFADDSTLLVDGVNGSIPYSVLSGTPTIPSIGNITFNTNTISAPSGSNVNIQTAVNVAGDAGDLVLTAGTGSGNDGTVYINTGGANQWTFDNGGDLTVPNNILFTAGNGIIQQDNEDFTILVQDSDDDDFELRLVVDDGAGIAQSRIRQRRDNVQIGVGLAGTAKYWQFNDNGVMTLPGDIDGDYGSTLKIGISTQSGSTTYIDTAVRSYIGDTELSKIRVGDTDIQIFTGSGNNEWAFLSGGGLSLPGGLNFTDGNLQPEGDHLHLTGNMGNYVKISADDVEKSWLFNVDGSLDTAGDVNLPLGASMYTTNPIYWQNGPGAIINNNSVNQFFNISTSVNSGTLKTWQFRYDGNLVIPGDIHSEQEINININLSDSTLRRWRFGEDGNLNLAGNLQFLNGAEIRDTSGALRLRAAPGEVAQLQGLDTSGFVDSAVKAYYDSGGLVTINTNIDAGSPEYVWTFDYVGGLTFPNGHTISTASAFKIQPANGTLLKLGDPTYAWDFDISDGSLTIPGNIKTTNTSIGLSTYRGADQGGLGDYTLTIDGINIISDKPGITVQSDNGYGMAVDGSGKLILLGEVSGDGILNFLFGDASITGEVSDVQLQTTNVGAPGTPSSFSITTQGDTNVWTFNGDGSLVIPGDIRSESAINIDINLSDSTLRRWSFGEDGVLNVPGAIQLSNGAQIFNTASAVNSITIGASDTNGTITFNGSGFFNSDVYFNKAIQEKFNTIEDATGTVVHDCTNGSIFYHTSPDANWTVNLTNFTGTLNYATAVTIIISQGGTGYYPNALQIGGAAQTINWQGNTSPTPSSNRVDVVSFSIFRTGAGYTVLGQLTGF